MYQNKWVIREYVPIYGIIMIQCEMRQNGAFPVIYYYVAVHYDMHYEKIPIYNNLSHKAKKFPTTAYKCLSNNVVLCFHLQSDEHECFGH